MKFTPLNRKTTITIAAAIIALLLMVIGSFYFVKTKKQASISSPNVILISVDTLSAKHLGVYGYERDTTPNIDAFAKKSTVYENAFTPVPCTGPSYASLFTGLNPATHASFVSTLNKKFTTLASNFKQLNYSTAAIYSNALLNNNISGLARGFDTYDGPDQTDVRAGRDNTYGLNGEKLAFQKGNRTTEEATKWLQKNDANQFFLFVQYVDPHLPYGQEAPFKDKYVEGDKENPLSDPSLQLKAIDKLTANSEDTAYLRDKYDENVAYVDQQIGELLKQIEARDLDKNTVIILTADHGESFENDTLGHCWRLYDSSIKIPMIIYDPRETNSKSVDSNVTLLDIYPTLSKRVGFGPLSYDLNGIDINTSPKNIKDSRESIYVVSNPLSTNPANPNRPREDSTSQEIGPFGKFIGQLYGQITGTKRIIYNQNSGKTEAYDTSNDPGELNNIIGKISSEYKEKLLLWISKNPLPSETETQSDLKYKTLQGLGYL